MIHMISGDQGKSLPGAVLVLQIPALKIGPCPTGTVKEIHPFIHPKFSFPRIWGFYKGKKSTPLPP